MAGYSQSVTLVQDFGSTRSTEFFFFFFKEWFKHLYKPPEVLMQLLRSVSAELELSLSARKGRAVSEILEKEITALLPPGTGDEGE